MVRGLPPWTHAARHLSSDRTEVGDDLTATPATPLVLAILCDGDSWGYPILQRVRERSGGQLEWTDGLVYPLLHRLRRLGYLTAEWRVGGEGCRRKYYAITDAGRAALSMARRRSVPDPGAVTGWWGGHGWLRTATTPPTALATSRTSCRQPATAAAVAS